MKLYDSFILWSLGSRIWSEICLAFSSGEAANCNIYKKRRKPHQKFEFQFKKHDRIQRQSPILLTVISIAKIHSFSRYRIGPIILNASDSLLIWSRFLLTFPPKRWAFPPGKYVFLYFCCCLEVTYFNTKICICWFLFRQIIVQFPKGDILYTYMDQCL